jgi:hypothetical protein
MGPFEGFSIGTLMVKWIRGGSERSRKGEGEGEKKGMRDT